LRRGTQSKRSFPIRGFPKEAATPGRKIIPSISVNNNKKKKKIGERGGRVPESGYPKKGKTVAELTQSEKRPLLRNPFKEPSNPEKREKPVCRRLRWKPIDITRDRRGLQSSHNPNEIRGVYCHG